VQSINDVVIGSPNGLSGSGVLATATFLAIGVGNNTITLADLGGVQELDNPPEQNGNIKVILFATSNCSFSILSTLPNVDFSHNGSIDFRDIVYFVDAYIQYYQCGNLNLVCDLNHDGKIDFADLQLFVECYVYYASIS
jgi:hypothetical protein